MLELCFSSHRSRARRNGSRSAALILAAWVIVLSIGAAFAVSMVHGWARPAQDRSPKARECPPAVARSIPLIRPSGSVAGKNDGTFSNGRNREAADKGVGQSDRAGERASTTDSPHIPPEVLLQLQAQLESWARIERSSLETALLQDCEDGQLHRFPFFAAVLVAGGTSENAIPRYETLLARHIANVRNLSQGNQNELAALRQIFRYLHESILTGSYQIAATNPAEALDTGRFNCVSAAILFRLLAESVGFRAVIRQLPTHAFCWVETATASIPVECTAARWLDDLDCSNPAQLAARLEGLTTAEAVLHFGDARRPISTARTTSTDWSVYAQGRFMSDVEVLGTIYYNRGVDYLFEKKFPQALAVNLVAVRLDPTNRSAKDNLLASLNNWAISLAEAEKFPEAASRLLWALRCAPSAQPVQANLVRLYRQWKSSLSKQGREGEFRTHLQKALATLEGIPGTEAVRNGLLQLENSRW